MTNNTIQTASNADVLARYGRSFIMGKAHAIWKFNRHCWQLKSFGEALKAAWNELRQTINRARQQAAKVAAYQGHAATRSPLNPHYRIALADMSRGGRAYQSTIAGR